MLAKKKGQQVMINAIYVFMVLVVMYFAYKMLNPMLPDFLAGKDTSTQVLIVLLIPAMFFFFLIYIFKTFRGGEG